jgi:hypothetical protein
MADMFSGPPSRYEKYTLSGMRGTKCIFFFCAVYAVCHTRKVLENSDA